MKLLFSVPTGYHIRELILPLRVQLEATKEIESIHIVTPAAKFHTEIFPGFSDKFQFHDNPSSLKGHKQLLSEIQPDLTITNTVGHDELDYPILKAAQELSLKTLTFIASWDNVWKISRLIDSGKPVALANSIIVWNTMMKAHILEIFPDLTDDRVNIVGAPRLDYFWQENNIPSKKDIYDILGFHDTSRPFIHFTTTELYPMDYIAKAIKQGIASGAIPENPYLYASVHPGGKIENHAKLKALGVTVRYSFGRVDNPLHPSFAYIPTEQSIYNLVGVFKHAAVLVNQSSTTALESLVANVPVINVKYGKPFDIWKWPRSMVYRDFKEHYADLLKDNATYLVKNKKELIDATNLSLQNKVKDEPARVKTLKRMITTIDGTAGQKVMNVLLNQL